ncbi:MAG TPA: arginine--tRNA ligase [Acidobacteriaceae bacterium]|nr:arginine--tRNA ligase [Acidobacteriaceae bacterium]
MAAAKIHLDPLIFFPESSVYRTYRQLLFARIQAILAQKYQIEIASLAVEQPPKVEFGEFALPVAFELAKRLKKAPRKIAEELVAELGHIDGFTSFEVAGAGYINGKLDRAAAARKIASGTSELPPLNYAIVEHTSINPNKAAHIGHLRNAILGDTLARMMHWGLKRSADWMPARVQNYIDNTGVQVADIVVALTHLEDMDITGVERWMESLHQRNERIDFVCWDLYANVSQWYEADPKQKEARKKIRMDTLHALEQGGNEIAQIAELVSTAIVRRHLETMERLNIEYDFLPRESEILHLHFWDAAFALMKERGVLYKETAGKNVGCWVMRRAGTDGANGDGPDEDAKVIVRSNGTVTYVGKDIAYHLWKFGKLGLNFEFKLFHTYPESTSFLYNASENRECYISTEHGIRPTPDVPSVLNSFNNAKAIYNVIDSRQNDPQNNVIEALRGMGFTKEAENYHHFSYEMVALTPRCAVELGYTLSDEDKDRPFIEVSGRKGFGVKADDLIDKLIEAAKAEVDARHPELDDVERRAIATKIAVGALRYYMLRYTRNSVIAFDFQDALSFEGETGPYAQYAVVRAANIFRKGNTTPQAALAALGSVDSTQYLVGEDGTSIWEVWLNASKSSLVLEQCIATTEPAYLAKYAFQLAQQFNNFYHRHHILTESDPARKALLLATAAVAHRELTRALSWLGIEVPEVM